MIKAIFFDVDGTLLSHKYHRIPESTIYALDQLKEKGILRVLATGRCMLELEQLQLEYMDFDAFITLNGQLILNQNHEIIIGNPIQGEDFDTLLKLYNEHTYPIQLIEEVDTYMNYHNEAVEKAQGDISTPLPEIRPYSTKPIYQSVAFVQEEGATEIEKLLPHCSITRWNNRAIDIIAKPGGKAYGIQQFLELHHIQQEETMAFGDDMNDIDMIEYVHIGVAMGNAKEEVKKIADYITKDIDATGIYFALKHFEII